MPRSHRLEDIKKAITHSVSVRGMVQYCDAKDYIQGIDALLHDFEDMIEEGRPDVASLIELTMKRMESNWGEGRTTPSVV